MDLRDALQQALGAQYTVERELGGGGMSRVFLALDRTLGRRIVAKVLAPELAAGVNRERFEQEVQLSAQLQHPNIVTVLGTGMLGELPYYTMPFVAGESLRAALEQRGTIPPREAVPILRDAARALAFAHARGVVHRDIKPDNVLLVRRAGVIAPVLIDFGIAVPITADGREAFRAGTPVYMAPEQLAGMASSAGTDVWAACVSLYETITGRVPFDGPDLVTTTRLVLEAPLAFPTEVAGFDGKLWAVLTRGLRKDPSDRTPTARDLKTALSDWLARHTALPPEPVAPAPRKRVPSEFEVLIRKKLTEG